MKTCIQRPRTRLLACESLESRLPLAGDVSVTLNAEGDLVLCGDRFDNHVEIVGNADGTVSLRGLDDTRIRFNGVLEDDAEFEISQPLLSLTAKLGRGDDELFVSNLALSGETSIDAGAGDDVVTLDGAAGEGEFALGVRVDLGAGDDALLADDQFVGKLSVNAGGGSDDVTLGGASGLASFTDVRVQLGAGNDLLSAAAVLDGKLNVDAGKGHDQITIGSTETGAAASSLGQLGLALGAGNDRLLLVNASVTGQSSIEAGSGNDDVTIGDADGDAGGSFSTTLAGNARIKLGVGGHDLLRIGGTLSGIAGPDVDSTTSFFGNLGIDGSNGKDCVLLAGAAVGGNVRFETGNGGDLILATDLAVSGNLNIKTGNGKDMVQVGGDLGQLLGPVGTAGVFVGGETSIETGNGKDLVAIEGAAEFSGSVRINLGNAADSLSITGAVDFSGDVNLDGGAGPNRLLLDETSVIVNAPAVLGTTGFVPVDPADLAEAVAELHAQIEQRAEDCLLGHDEDDEDDGDDDNGRGHGFGHLKARGQGHGNGRGNGHDRD